MSGLDLLASDDARYVTGHCLFVDAGHTTAGIAANRFHLGPPQSLCREAGIVE